jgi:hypothetical protein
MENKKNDFIILNLDGKQKRLDKKQAILLCRDGIKYNSLKDNYERLISAAKAENLSVPDYLDTLDNIRTQKRKEELIIKCGGNEEMALHIMELEDGKTVDRKNEEFKKFFPQTDIEKLPESVKQNAKFNNTSLLDEYFRYNARLENEKRENEIKRKENEISATGSLKGEGDISFESSEFLKGVWR